MDINLFSKTCKRVFDQYFKKIETALASGQLLFRDKNKCTLKFPTMLITAKTDDVLYVELIGSSSTRRPLRIKKSSVKDFEMTISLNNKTKNSGFKFKLQGEGSCIMNTMIGDSDREVIEDTDRFPMSKYFDGGVLGTDNISNTLTFSDDFISSRLSNILVTSTRKNIYKARYISEMIIFKKDIDIRKLEFLLDEYCFFPRERGEINFFGVYIDNDSKKEFDTSHLQNLVLIGGVHETAIGDFLNDHPQILLKSLGYCDFIYEPSLEWIHKIENNPDKFINPDLLLKRPDGNYDICDLKKGLINKKSLTKDERRRRRFIDPVNEGLAQLANYEEYFTYKENLKHANDKYDISILEPNKVLIIGNKTNSNSDEIKEALRGHSNISVIDYESIISLYLANSRIF